MSYILYYKKEKALRYVKPENILDELYYIRGIVPTEKILSDSLKDADKKVKQLVKDKTNKQICDEIRDDISKIDNKIPLYDEYTKNLFLIPREYVYNRVTYQSYRFPNKQLIELLKERKKKIKSKFKKDIHGQLEDIEKWEGVSYESLKESTEDWENIIMYREYRKLYLMLTFMNFFNLNILETTYIKVFYYYANEVGKNITVCIKPSFLPHFSHIKPYYTRSELINLALNMELIKESNKYYDQESVMKLCGVIKKNDISANTILEHQKYIIEQNKIGVVQYFSLQGSYFMNQYLRGMSSYEYKNELLENIIESIWDLIYNAPPFDKSYTLYRFVSNDSYLKHLKIGDSYIDPSFISTTRDPFYRSETYKFGFILVKIKIPSGTKGVGLCIESYSLFPEEQEIVLPPLSVLRLDKKDEGALYYHTDDIYASNIITRYEFTLIDKNPIKLMSRPVLPSPNKVIDFLELENIITFTIYEKIKKFVNDYVNEIYQFRVKIGEHEMDLMVEWYDSTNAYKKFYGATTKNGFSIYTIQNNYFTFFIELGEENNETFMFVNYISKFSAFNKNKYIKDINFIDFISKIGYYFGIKNILLYTEYISCDISAMVNKNKKYGGSYSNDFYHFLKYKKKRFMDEKIDTIELKPKFSYYELDRLRTINPLKILKVDDRDELYQIYVKIYKNFVNEEKHNIADFYIWLVENMCISLDLLVSKMDRIYKGNNPFEEDYYIFDPIGYLYNRNMITDYNIDENIKKSKLKITNECAPKNEYRLQYYQKLRT
jgi:hypothetical protein